MKQKLDFDFKLTNLKGEVDPHAAHAGELIGLILSADKSPEYYLKYFTWAMEVYNKRPLELDASDIKILKDWVQGGDKLTSLARAQIMKVIEDAEDANKAPASTGE